MAIVFFYGIANTLAPYVGHSKLIYFIGTQTKPIVYHHQLLFILFSMLFACLHKLLGWAAFGDINLNSLRTSNYYCFPENKYISTLIIILSILLPIAFQRLIQKQSISIARRFIVSVCTFLLIMIFLFLASRILQ